MMNSVITLRISFVFLLEYVHPSCLVPGVGGSGGCDEAGGIICRDAHLASTKSPGLERLA
jgi:hypothetical protein